MKSFDMSLILMFKTAFKQPIFGSNFYQGKCKPLMSDPYTGDLEYKIWFMNGGADKFLRAIAHYL